MDPSAAGYRLAPAGVAVAVTVSTVCATGTPIADALLLVSGAVGVLYRQARTRGDQDPPQYPPSRAWRRLPYVISFGRAP
ncbi:hypothetical protein [Streptomyces sp. SPB4]|uniref:hypothetical protein n=1 Tax=Streptomyces sp. SPB4 TaxID=2940553 RepID=UPI00247598EE|nr:hypothetical protein [Streptomyces sp. SPB4]MDH6542901.1 hypothetical protein [Streptomyces sp. SPB4]